jgi:hypothetical protein
MGAADASAALSILTRDAALAQRPWRWNPSMKSIVYLSGGTPPNMSGSRQQAMVLGILLVPFEGQFASHPRRAYASSASLRADRTRLQLISGRVPPAQPRPRKTAFWRTPPAPGPTRERVLRVEGGRTLRELRSSQKGGLCAYAGRLGKDRSARQSRHCIASAKCALPPLSGRLTANWLSAAVR